MKNLLILASFLFVYSCQHQSKSGDTKGGTTESSEKNAKSSASTTKCIKCTKSSDIRELQLSQSAGSCETIYTKDGKTSTVASAKNDLSYCDKIYDRIQKKLTDSGYQCN